jgi:hypothetical protein
LLLQNTSPLHTMDDLMNVMLAKLMDDSNEVPDSETMLTMLDYLKEKSTPEGVQAIDQFIIIMLPRILNYFTQEGGNVGEGVKKLGAAYICFLYANIYMVKHKGSRNAQRWLPEIQDSARAFFIIIGKVYDKGDTPFKTMCIEFGKRIQKNTELNPVKQNKIPTEMCRLMEKKK